jgi:large subunit ribosomal protein L5
MADTEEKQERKPKGGASAEGGAPAEKAERAPKQAKQDKGGKAEAKSDKPAAPREPEPKVPARLKVQFDEKIRDKLVEQFGYKNKHSVPTIDKIVINMGIGEGVADRKKVDNAAPISPDRRTEADRHQGAQVDCDLQAARRSGDRLQGHAAQGADVRIPRSADQHRAAARARLPRPQSEELRRPRQLFARHQGTHHFPGDRLRQGADIWGMDITVCTTARTDDEARALLTEFNFPFRQ